MVRTKLDFRIFSISVVNVKFQHKKRNIVYIFTADQLYNASIIASKENLNRLITVS